MWSAARCNTPAFRRVARDGICYNTFHTTSICSPTRAALLTGRNHHRVHSGTIAERAVDWDGYTGVIGKDTATVAEVLQHYGYKTAAFGKWHNSPATETTAMGPVRPLAHRARLRLLLRLRRRRDVAVGAAPLREHSTRSSRHTTRRTICPRIWRTEPSRGCGKHEAFAPDEPFLMYWAPGAAHGPHHIFKEWADKYKGKFDDGWDKYRERVFARQKETGWIPTDAAADAARRHDAGLG